MPGIEEDLRAALGDDVDVAALVGDRIYPHKIPPHDSPSPWIYYTIPSEEPDEDLDANTSAKMQVEIEIYAETFSLARSLKLAVRAVLNGYRGGHIDRCLWVGGDSGQVEDGHNVTERYTLWGATPTIVPSASSNARILTGAGVIYLYPNGSGVSIYVTADGVLHGDGSGLTGLPEQDLTEYARLDVANSFAVGGHTMLLDGQGTTPGLRVRDNAPTAEHYLIAAEVNHGRKIGFYAEAGGNEGGIKADSVFTINAGNQFQFYARSTGYVQGHSIVSRGGVYEYRLESSTNRLCISKDSAHVVISLGPHIAPSASDVPLSSQGAASQTADLYQAKDSGGTVLAGVTAAGRLRFNASDSAPSNTTTIVAWVTVVVGGTTYKLPLYQ